MRMIDWHRALLMQRERFGKVVFSQTELAHIGNVRVSSLNMALRRLVWEGVLTRYAPGRYGLPGAVQADDLVCSLDPSAYLTGFFMLHKNGLITQRPLEITCFTNHRHNRSRVRQTCLGRLVFVCVKRPVYHPPADIQALAAEQALCDTVFLLRRQGVDMRHVVTFRKLELLNPQILNAHLERYPATVGQTIHALITEGYNIKK